MTRVSLDRVALSNVVERLRAAGCVFAEEEAALLHSAAVTANELAALVERRVAGQPLEHILGWAEFCGLRVAVEPGVFVPRRRSEFLATTAVASSPNAAVIVDMCCGSGALALVLGVRLPDAQLHAVDIDPRAVSCARVNIALIGGEIHEGDLFDALPTQLSGRIDLLVANAPYIPTESIAFMPAEARDHEPLIALDGGPDGLDIQRRIVASAPQWLAPGGQLLVETSEQQAPETAGFFDAAGLESSIHRGDDVDATVVVGVKA